MTLWGIEVPRGHGMKISVASSSASSRWSWSPTSACSAGSISCSAISSTTAAGGCSTLSETTLTRRGGGLDPERGRLGAGRAGTRRRAPGKPVILYYRGNARSFSREHERFEQFVADGYGFMSFDYRGFPGSPGEVTEENVLADGLAAFDWLEAKGFPILIWARSLGSGPGNLRGEPARGRRAVPRNAVHLGGRGRRRPLRVPAGRAADARPVSGDRMAQGRRRAGVRRARHRGQDHRGLSRRAGLCAGAQPGWASGSKRAPTTTSSGPPGIWQKAKAFFEKVEAPALKPFAPSGVLRLRRSAGGVAFLDRVLPSV